MQISTGTATVCVLCLHYEIFIAKAEKMLEFFLKENHESTQDKRKNCNTTAAVDSLALDANELK